MDDVGVGTYATSGNTSLVSVGSINPIYVQFSISENEYLNFRTGDKPEREGGEEPLPPKATLTLSNGQKYDEVSTEYIADRELSESTGTLTLKAVFDNADGVLLPGMFARVTVEGRPLKDAILVPQRAVQQVLEEAAQLAAYHSKARDSAQVPVDYCAVRYVKKPADRKSTRLNSSH